MDLRIFTEPQQGASHDDLPRVARATEELGFDAFFRSDHYLVMGNFDGLPGPSEGLGAGWFEAEHAAYGLDFPEVGERFDRLEEQLEIIAGLWATPVGETFTHHGRFYTLVNAPGLPEPAQQPGPPIIMGATGKRRTPALAVRYAAEFNVAFKSIEDTPNRLSIGYGLAVTRQVATEHR